MDYKEAILSEEVRIEKTRFSTTDYNEFLSFWYSNACSVQDITKSSRSRDNAYSVLSENTLQLFDMVNEMQNKFSLFGFCNKCDMYDLTTIIAHNMKLEEYCVDDDEYIDSEHDEV